MQVVVEKDREDVRLIGVEELYECCNGHPLCYWHLEASSYCPACKGLGREALVDITLHDFDDIDDDDAP